MHDAPAPPRPHRRLASGRRRALLSVASALAVLTAPACEPSRVAAAGADAQGARASAPDGGGTARHRGEAKHKADPKLRGAVLLNDKWIPVAPFVGHDAHMDLYVQCKEARDRASAAGRPAPALCYEDARVNEPKHLRVEYAEGRSGGAAMRALRQADGGAHFLIERNGSIRQILDLAYPPRRGGSIRPGEVRVLSGNRAAHEALVAALVKAFPGLDVEVVAPSAPAPKPASPKATAPKPSAPKAASPKPASPKPSAPKAPSHPPTR